MSLKPLSHGMVAFAFSLLILTTDNSFMESIGLIGIGVNFISIRTERR